MARGTIESPEDTQESAEKEEAGGRVKLMTLHASKGLEFDTVFIIGVNPGLLPIRCSSFDQEEEERRLFFVESRVQEITWNFLITRIRENRGYWAVTVII